MEHRLTSNPVASSERISLRILAQRGDYANTFVATDLSLCHSTPSLHHNGHVRVAYARVGETNENLTWTWLGNRSPTQGNTDATRLAVQ